MICVMFFDDYSRTLFATVVSETTIRECFASSADFGPASLASYISWADWHGIGGISSVTAACGSVPCLRSKSLVREYYWTHFVILRKSRERGSRLGHYCSFQLIPLTEVQFCYPASMTGGYLPLSFMVFSSMALSFQSRNSVLRTATLQQGAFGRNAVEGPFA